MERDERKRLIELTEAQSIEALWAMHVRTMAAYGFDRLLYGFTRYRTATSLGNPRDFVVLSNHSRAYTEAFIDGGLYLSAPLVNWARDNEGACSWAVLDELDASGRLSADERRVIDFNRKHDVTAGYTISFTSVSSRAKGAIALTGRAGLSQAELDATWARHGDLLTAMNNIVHLKILTLPYVPRDQNLTPRQRETLEWVGDGKTMQDIATIMGLTQATVEKHLRLAREALDVQTTAQAVLKAAFQNQMFVLEDRSITNP